MTRVTISALLIVCVSFLASVDAGCDNKIKKTLCRTSICGRYRRQRPMPLIFQSCTLGCEAAYNQKSNVNCHAVCSRTPTPRPTTTNACQAGCYSMQDRFQSCFAVENVETMQQASSVDVSENTENTPTNNDEQIIAENSDSKIVPKNVPAEEEKEKRLLAEVQHAAQTAAENQIISDAEALAAEEKAIEEAGIASSVHHAQIEAEALASATIAATVEAEDDTTLL